jgi:hypothetical protein
LLLYLSLPEFQTIAIARVLPLAPRRKLAVLRDAITTGFRALAFYNLLLLANANTAMNDFHERRLRDT